MMMNMLQVGEYFKGVCTKKKEMFRTVYRGNRQMKLKTQQAENVSRNREIKNVKNLKCSFFYCVI